MKGIAWSSAGFIVLAGALVAHTANSNVIADESPKLAPRDKPRREPNPDDLTGSGNNIIGNVRGSGTKAKDRGLGMAGNGMGPVSSGLVVVPPGLTLDPTVVQLVSAKRKADQAVIDALVAFVLAESDKNREVARVMVRAAVREQAQVNGKLRAVELELTRTLLRGTAPVDPVPDGHPLVK